MVKLSIQDSEGRTTIVPLSDGELAIGRDDANAICLTDRNVSRRHAKLEILGSRVWIENVAASWGTRLNKLLVRERTELTGGDILQIGDYTLEIESEEKTRRDNALVDEAQQGQPTNARASRPGDNATAMINLADIQNAGQPAGPATAIPESSQPRLAVESENLRGLELRITKTPIVIGRVRENADLVLDHRSISKEHARLTRLSDGSWQLLDLGSANGLKVNGEPYSKCDIQSGDRIELGHVMLRFLAPGVATPALENVGPPSRNRLPIAIAVAVAAAIVATIAVVVVTGAKKETGGAKGAANDPANPGAPADPGAPTDPGGASPGATSPGATAPAAGGVEGAPGAQEPPAAGDAAKAGADKPAAAGGTAIDALAKAEEARKAGEYATALEILRAAEAAKPGSAQVAMKIKQIEAERTRRGKLDAAEAKLDANPAAALEMAAEVKAQLPAGDPLLAAAEKVIAAAHAGIAEKHRAAKAETAHAEPRANAEPKGKAEPKVEVKPEPNKPEPKIEPKPKPPEEIKPAVVAKTGADYYQDGRAAQLEGKTDAAIGLYQQAVKAGYGKAHKQLALLFQARNDKAGCAKNAKAYLEKNPSAGDADAMQQLLDKCAN